MLNGIVEKRTDADNIEFVTDQGRVIATMAEESADVAVRGQKLRLICFNGLFTTAGFVVMTRCRTADLAFSRMFASFDEAFVDLFQGKDTEYSAIKPLIPLSIAYARKLQPGSHCDASAQDYDTAKCWQSINAVNIPDKETLAVKAELKALGMRL